MTKEERREYHRKWRETHRESRLNSGALYRSKKRIARAKAALKRRRDAAFARRDAEYAAAHVPVTVEVRGNRVIETRGHVCIASRCTHITHN